MLPSIINPIYTVYSMYSLGCLGVCACNYRYLQPNASRFRLYTERSIQSDAVAQATSDECVGVPLQFATCTLMCRDFYYHMYANYSRTHGLSRLHKM